MRIRRTKRKRDLFGSLIQTGEKEGCQVGSVLLTLEVRESPGAPLRPRRRAITEEGIGDTGEGLSSNGKGSTA